MTIDQYFTYSKPVAEALAQGAPVVALESTIIAHGMPFPRNLETAQLLECTVRDNGAIPATIAILDGRIHIGLSDDQLKSLAQAKDVLKASRRDIAFAVSAGKTAATTVAGTMLIARLAGIRIFATGGIGGVHRGAPSTFDISADLQELAHNPVTVVTAGAKAILDLNLTLEYLETCGVPVIGYRTIQFPAFYSKSSGLKCAHRLETPGEIAKLMHAQHNLGLETGIIIANPIPDPFAMDPKEIDIALNHALADADSRGIHGKDITPYLLARIVEHTEGRSLESNVALVNNNAALAARISVKFNEMI